MDSSQLFWGELLRQLVLYFIGRIALFYQSKQLLLEVGALQVQREGGFQQLFDVIVQDLERVICGVDFAVEASLLYFFLLLLHLDVSGHQ